MITVLGIVEKLWNEGFQDMVSLRRQRQLLETVAETAAETAGRAPDLVDYDGTNCFFSFVGSHYKDRSIAFSFSRFGGTAKVMIPKNGEEVAPVQAVPVRVREAFAWVDEKKARKRRRKEEAV